MIKISLAAQLLGVSQSTIRNWVKSGDLQSQQRGHITQDSFDTIKKSVVGRNKLISRANKKHKSGGASHQEGYPADMWQKYESSLSDALRNREGIYYTPEDIVQKMISTIKCNKVENSTFLDPCCGGGNFIIEAIKRGFKPSNVYGYDTDTNAVEITKYRIEQLTGYRSNNIICRDFLYLAQHTSERFDYIYTNPPWGKKLTSTEREHFAKMYSTTKSIDSSSLFMLASLRLLSSGGYMGFLVQGALFNIASYEAIRKHLLNHNITNLLDFDRPFKSLMTKAQAVILKNEPTLNNQVLCESSSRSYYRDARSFQDNPCCILNMWSTPQSSDVIERLLKQPHTTLQKHVRWGLGIVTGNNRRFISSTPNSGYINIFRGEDITEVGFKESPLYIPDDMSLYQQVAPVELWRAECKIVYKFISSKLTFMCDREQRFVLNSANFFILDREFPLSAEQLVQLLNSNFMNWYFHELYNTHKILRRDLEALPIFCDYFTAGKIFNEDEYLNHIGVERVEHTEYRVKIEVGTNI